ncbi:MAG: hypothetical protein WCW27_00910 [Patescibacteria group bacterium]|jgi:hypothetical protein
MEQENKIILMQQALDNAATQLSQARRILSEISLNYKPSGLDITTTAEDGKEQQQKEQFEGNVQVIEGVFNGQNMVSAEGKIFAIPANYVSKSKLVEGDLLKLTVRQDGSFVYKQIGPVERKRLVGVLEQNQTTGDYHVVVEQRSYRVIMASVTYFKGQPGNEVVILTPKDGNSTWAAVENVIHSNNTNATLLTDGSDAELTSGVASELSNGAEAELTS